MNDVVIHSRNHAGPVHAAGVSVAVHAAAGLLAEQRIGSAGVLASDIARLLPEAMTVLRGGGPRAPGETGNP